MSLENIVSIILYILGIYLLIGFIFSIAFVMRGAGKVDPAAKGISWWTKLLLIPASTAFWVVLLRKWIAKNKK